MPPSYIDIIRNRWNAQPVESFADEMISSLSVAKFAESRWQKAERFWKIVTEVAPARDEDPDQLVVDLKQLVNDLFSPDFFDHRFPELDRVLEEFGKNWGTMIAPFCDIRDNIVRELHSRIEALAYVARGEARTLGELNSRIEQAVAASLPSRTPGRPSGYERRKMKTDELRTRIQAMYEESRREHPDHSKVWHAMGIAKKLKGEDERAWKTVYRILKP